MTASLGQAEGGNESMQTGLERSGLPVTELRGAFYRRAGMQVGMLRLDLTHPQISGNKWFKLLPLIRRLRAGERPRVLSFGGVWSNHLHALAWLGHQFGIETLGLVRGHPEQADTAMLQDARRWGMQIRFLDRDTYRQRDQAEFRRWLSASWSDWEQLPEGGSSAAAVAGCREIWQQIADPDWQQPDYVACAMGTGGTLAGLIAGKPARTRVIGVPALNLGEAGESMVRRLLQQAGISDPGGWALDRGLHTPGYGRLPLGLAAFVDAFEQRHAVPLDPVYTVRLLATLQRRILTGQFAPGARILLIHSGGLQGRRGLEQRLRAGASAFHGPHPV